MTSKWEKEGGGHPAVYSGEDSYLVLLLFSAGLYNDA